MLKLDPRVNNKVSQLTTILEGLSSWVLSSGGFSFLSREKNGINCFENLMHYTNCPVCLR